MDTKNVIAAISLSAAVIILYTLFFAPSPQELKKIQEENKSQVTDTTEAPNLEVEEKIIEISRDEAKYLAKKMGAKIQSAVSKSTDFVIIGDKAGSKEKKAKELKIKILSEEEFLKKINS